MNTPLIIKKKSILVRNSVVEKPLFHEYCCTVEGQKYRELDPTHSKYGAAIMKGMKHRIQESDAVLYLGVSHGYTASFVADIVGKKGIVFGIDPAPRVMRDCVLLAQHIPNLAPIFADASHPETYTRRVCEVDVVFQDIAQKHQAQIFIQNCALFLKKKGIGFLALKAKSIDITKQPKEIYQSVRFELLKQFEILETLQLEPFEKDHCVFVVKKK